MNFYNISNGKVIVSGFKNNKMSALNIADLSTDFAPITLNGDIDTVKIMVWNSVGDMYPLTKAEIIQQNDMR